jgi:hypothetical protein
METFIPPVNNILRQLKPIKILGKGSQGTIILSHDDNYVVKIYTNPSKNLKMLVRIINYFINYKNLPKTIYHPFHITNQKNSLERYIQNNNLPDHFSYSNKNNLKILNKEYEMKPRLFEIMQKYDITLKKFIEDINISNENLKLHILHSFLYQGLFTLLWLYMKKGIVHLDISTENFFVEKTDDKEFVIEIKNITYTVKLYGYYLVLGDFGYGRSIEFVDYNNYEYDIRVNIGYLDIHPRNDIINFIKIFKKYFKDIGINNIGLNNNIGNFRMSNTNQDYKNMLRAYYKKKEFKLYLKIFKNEFFNNFRKYILNENIES